jgi:Zn-dependent membrane protease YugP
MFLGFDPVYWVFLAPALLLTFVAQARLKSAYGKWSRIEASSRMSGAEAAQHMLRQAGVADVTVEPVQGMLSDHYDPRAKTLRLSPGVYQSRSVAAMGIACHEAGHALQDAQGYAPLGLRTMLVPVVSFGSRLAMPLILGGMLMSMFLRGAGGDFGFLIAQLGVVAFAAVVVFQLVTLPVEFDASNRAKRQLMSLGIIQSQQEAGGVAAVLNAAALTYVAAAATALAQLLYFAMRLGLLGRRD